MRRAAPEVRRTSVVETDLLHVNAIRFVPGERFAAAVIDSQSFQTGPIPEPGQVPTIEPRVVGASTNMTVATEARVCFDLGEGRL